MLLLLLLKCSLKTIVLQSNSFKNKNILIIMLYTCFINAIYSTISSTMQIISNTLINLISTFYLIQITYILLSNLSMFLSYTEIPLIFITRYNFINADIYYLQCPNLFSYAFKLTVFFSYLHYSNIYFNTFIH